MNAGMRSEEVWHFDVVTHEHLRANHCFATLFWHCKERLRCKPTHPPSYAGADQYTPTELVDTTETLSSDGGDGGLRLGITLKSDSGFSLPATSSVMEMFPAWLYAKSTGIYGYGGTGTWCNTLSAYTLSFVLIVQALNERA